jgi:hypothetical protein
MSFHLILEQSITGVLYLTVTYCCLLHFREPPGHILVLADVKFHNLRSQKSSIYITHSTLPRLVSERGSW